MAVYYLIVAAGMQIRQRVRSHLENAAERIRNETVGYLERQLDRIINWVLSGLNRYIDRLTSAPTAQAGEQAVALETSESVTPTMVVMAANRALDFCRGYEPCRNATNEFLQPVRLLKAHCQ